MFIAALFAIAKTCKQPEWPLTRGMDQEDVVHTQWNITQPLKGMK